MLQRSTAAAASRKLRTIPITNNATLFSSPRCRLLQRTCSFHHDHHSPAASAAAAPSSFGVSSFGQDEESIDDLLVQLKSARLCFPPPPSRHGGASSSSSLGAAAATLTAPIDLTIRRPSFGGHVVLGRNGTGKTLLSHAVVGGGRHHGHGYDHGDSDDSVLHSGSIRHYGDADDLTNPPPQHNRIVFGGGVSRVSFESHEELLHHGHNHGESMTVYKALSHGSGRLPKAAQFLAIRFGLYPLLHRPVSVLSTGEIRKVTLLRALSIKPKLLVLDNAFDGLDASSRVTLSDLVSKTLRGFRNDVLVQSIDAKNAAHTQVLLVTHRPEEIVDEVSTVSYFAGGDDDDGGGEGTGDAVAAHPGGGGGLRTEARNGRTGDELFRDGGLRFGGGIDANLPSPDEIASLWGCTAVGDGRHRGEDRRRRRRQLGWNPPRHRRGLRNATTTSASPCYSSSSSPHSVLVEARNLRVRRGDSTLLHDLNWTVRKGERWVVFGGNGAGKSTLTRLVAGGDDDGMGGKDHDDDESSRRLRRLRQLGVVGGTLDVPSRQGGGGGVGWVSTELHLRMSRSDGIARDVMKGLHSTDDGTASSPMAVFPPSDDDVVDAVARWVGLDCAAKLSRPFATLSQGEQKLVLIAAALARRPSLLVLDEPCHGLDPIRRERVLNLVERVCRSTDVSLVYITHHQEEIMPSVSHALHLSEGTVAYSGELFGYDPDSM